MDVLEWYKNLDTPFSAYLRGDNVGEAYERALDQNLSLLQTPEGAMDLVNPIAKVGGLLGRIYPLKTNLQFFSDIPSKEWLKGKQDSVKPYAKADAPLGGASITGGVAEFGDYATKPVVPVNVLKKLKGLNKEQDNVRESSKEWLKDYMTKNDHLPTWYYAPYDDIYKTGLHGGIGKNLPLGQKGVMEQTPYIMVDQNGVGWINEGNHRIMVADELGWENLPVEIRYFNGGELVDGLLSPEKIKKYNKTGNWE